MPVATSTARVYYDSVPSETDSVVSNMRLKGLLKLLGGALVFAVILAYFMRAGLTPGRSPFKIIGPAIPGAFALVGLVELVTGMPIRYSPFPGCLLAQLSYTYHL